MTQLWSQGFAFVFLVMSLVLSAYAGPALAQPVEPARNDSVEVMRSYTETTEGPSERVAISDAQKARVMFYMGVPLIVLLLLTVILGVAMAVFGKPLFVAHMICAGLSLTLALAHAIVGVVWFYPF